MKANKHVVFWIVVVIFVSAAVGMALGFTRFGPGASGDSVYYVMGAENISLGNGFSRTSGGGEIKPVTGFPPFYPMVLSLLYSEGVDLFASARLLNALIFGFNILLSLILIYRYTDSLFAAATGGLLLLFSDTLLQWHGWVMSEPLYIALFLIAIYCFLEYFESRKLLWLIISGLAGGSAILTRYVGIALFPALALLALFLNQRPWKKRIWDSVVLTIFLLAPLLYLILINRSGGGTGINRQITYHMMRPELAWQYLTEISSWFAPNNLPFGEIVRAVIAIFIAIGLPSLFIRTFLREAANNRIEQTRKYFALPWSLAVYIFAFLGVLVINSLLLDAGTTASAPPRYLLPVYVATVILFVSITSMLLKRIPQRRGVQSLGVLYACVLVFAAFSQSAKMMIDPMPYIGYSNLEIGYPKLEETLKGMDRDTIAISNNPEMVYFLMGRPAYMRPIGFDNYSLQYRQDYEDQIDFVQGLLDSGAVYIQMRDPSQEELDVINDLEIEPVLVIHDATIYTSSKLPGSNIINSDSK